MGPGREYVDRYQRLLIIWIASSDGPNAMILHAVGPLDTDRQMSLDASARFIFVSRTLITLVCVLLVCFRFSVVVTMRRQPFDCHSSEVRGKQVFQEKPRVPQARSSASVESAGQVAAASYQDARVDCL